MPDITQSFALRAQLIFPVSAPPLQDSVVTVAGGRIVAVGENVSGKPAFDLGDVALLPGLVNPHTHLEFSLLAQPLGHAGMTLPAWIAEVVRRRRAAEVASSEGSDVDRRRATVAGLHECLTHGVTTVGDIVTADLNVAAWHTSPVHWIAFRELLGQTPDAVARQTEVARRHLDQVAVMPRAQAALSPHAPYSTSRDLIMEACRLSSIRRCPVALHLAESLDELRLLADGTGPLREVLEQLGAWYPVAFPGGNKPRDYLELLSTAHRSLVVHGNYLRAADWDFLAARAQRMAVVYCPRTHEYFRHEPYPLAAMLQRGVRVVVGTDGRASTPNLRLWDDLRTVARTHPQVPTHRILRMGTLDAAAALGCDDEVGSLDVGKRADLALIRIHPGHAAHPDAALWDSEHTLQTAICGGLICGGLIHGGQWIDQRRQQ